jgi:hypothetical protein
LSKNHHCVFPFVYFFKHTSFLVYKFFCFIHFLSLVAISFLISFCFEGIK